MKIEIKIIVLVSILLFITSCFADNLNNSIYIGNDFFSSMSDGQYDKAVESCKFNGSDEKDIWLNSFYYLEESLGGIANFELIDIESDSAIFQNQRENGQYYNLKYNIRFSEKDLFVTLTMFKRFFSEDIEIIKLYILAEENK